MLTKRRQSKSPPRSSPKKNSKAGQQPNFLNLNCPQSSFPGTVIIVAAKFSAKKGRATQNWVLQKHSQYSSMQQPSSSASEQQQRIDINHIHALERHLANIKHSELTLTAQEKQRRDPTTSRFNYCLECQTTLNAPLKSTSTWLICGRITIYRKFGRSF